MRTLGTVSLLFLGLTATVVAACSANSTPVTFGHGGHGNSSGSGNSTGSGNSGTGGETGITLSSGSTSSSSGSGMGCPITDMNQDMDHDGWTPAQGDCNDCDPNVNPGAVDVVPTAGADGGVGPNVDSDCNGKFDPPQPCDTGLMLGDISGVSGAKAIELCQFTSETPPTPQQKVWGVLNAGYVHANGTPFNAPGLQVGLQPNFGPNVHTQGGSTMVAISSGHARTSSQAGGCGSMSCSNSGQGTPPPGFPQDNPACPPSPNINDDVGLQLKIRAPTNATGYSFSFKFYSMEYPFYVCDTYNDQFIALVSPAPMGSINGNISFDSKHAPVSVNLGFFDICDPSQIGQYAADCGGCASPPSPYCPSGTAQLQGTGFDVWDSFSGGAGATSWLKSQAPIQGGSEFTIRFAIWDTGDTLYDSTTLIDNFQWIATAGTVSVGTTPIGTPK